MSYQHLTGPQLDEIDARAAHLYEYEPLPVPEWVATVRAAASGEHEPTDRPALPWAHTMPDDDLHGFLDDLVSAAVDRWRSDPDVPDREILANIERVCANWRTPGQGHRSDEPEAGESR